MPLKGTGIQFRDGDGSLFSSKNMKKNRVSIYTIQYTKKLIPFKSDLCHRLQFVCQLKSSEGAKVVRVQKQCGCKSSAGAKVVRVQKVVWVRKECVCL